MEVEEGKEGGKVKWEKQREKEEGMKGFLLLTQMRREEGWKEKKGGGKRGEKKGEIQERGEREREKTGEKKR